MFVFSIALIISLSFYIPLILSYIKGWSNLENKNIPDKTNMEKVSVIIAVRNEEKNVAGLYEDLIAQSYPAELIEIIFVNDHSSDKTVPILKNLIKEEARIHLCNLSDSKKGKKAAIREGVQKATGSIILTTDADCRVSTEWVDTMISWYKHVDCKLVLGPVKLTGEGCFSVIQQLEMLSLMGSTAGSTGQNKPIMANAANMAFEKSVYQDVKINDGIPTGDDVFLLEHVQRRYPKRISFALSEKAIVETSSLNVIHFIHQRLRWASKSRFMKNRQILYAGFVIGMLNFLLFSALVLSFFDPGYLVLFGTGMILKSHPDFLLIVQTNGLFRQKKVLHWFVPVQLAYPIYATVFAVVSTFYPYSWKGRRK